MHRLPIAALAAALALAATALGITACGGSSTPQISQDVSSAPGAGADKDSLFHADNLAKAISTLKDKFGATIKVTDVKVEPGAIKVTSPSGVLIVGKHFETEGVNTPTGSDLTGGGGFSPSTIDTSAPEKIVKKLASKGVTLANVNYFLVSSVLSSSSKPGWLIYTTKGDFQAHADGSHARPLGGGTVTTTITGNDNGGSSASQAKKAAKAAQGAAQSLSDCIQKAGTDPTKIKACAGQ